jgi:ABC-2 type transport system ATP-binding protein
VTALSFEGVSKRYGETHALSAVTFEAKAGEILGLLGQNGAGKTTLIRIALGLVPADTGTTKVLGQAPSPRVLDALGYLPEERGLPRRARSLEILAYIARLKGWEKARAQRAAEDWLERVELTPYANRPFESMSKGTAQRLQLAAALVTDPELAILDEPMSGLDPVNVELVRALLVGRRARGLTTVLSTHHMAHVESLCDRIVMIHEGRNVLSGTIEEILGADEVRARMEDVFVKAVRDAKVRP